MAAANLEVHAFARANTSATPTKATTVSTVMLLPAGDRGVMRPRSTALTSASATNVDIDTTPEAMSTHTTAPGATSRRTKRL